jgi:hypothetical protein
MTEPFPGADAFAEMTGAGFMTVWSTGDTGMIVALDGLFKWCKDRDDIDTFIAWKDNMKHNCGARAVVKEGRGGPQFLWAINQECFMPLMRWCAATMASIQAMQKTDNAATEPQEDEG